MPEMRLEFPQLDTLLSRMDIVERKLDELAQWVRPDSFVQNPSDPNSDAASATKPATALPATSYAAPMTAAPAPVPTTPANSLEAPIAAPTVAPSYTQEQVSKAGADLLAAHPDKMPALMALLQKFGVPAVTSLQPGQLGSFATELRGLGAAI